MPALDLSPAGLHPSANRRAYWRQGEQDVQGYIKSRKPTPSFALEDRTRANKPFSSHHSLSAVHRHTRHTAIHTRERQTDIRQPAALVCQ
jgi:hypothetical protein